MTVNELIQRLQELGDEKWRDIAEVRVLDYDEEELADAIDPFDIKFAGKWCDIHIDCPPLATTLPDDEYDDWDDVDEEEDEEEDDSEGNALEQPVS